MCGAEVQPLPKGVQRVMAALEAMGHLHGVFRLAPQDLGLLTGPPLADVALR